MTEPGVAARHDLGRILDLAERSGVPATVVVNRFDLAPDLTARIEGECAARGVPLAGRIPYDPEIVRAIMDGRPPIRGREGPAARAMREIADAVLVNEEGRITA